MLIDFQLIATSNFPCPLWPTVCLFRHFEYKLISYINPEWMKITEHILQESMTCNLSGSRWRQGLFKKLIISPQPFIHSIIMIRMHTFIICGYVWSAQRTGASISDKWVHTGIHALVQGFFSLLTSPLWRKRFRSFHQSNASHPSSLPPIFPSSMYSFKNQTFDRFLQRICCFVPYASGVEGQFPPVCHMGSWCEYCCWSAPQCC